MTAPEQQHKSLGRWIPTDHTVPATGLQAIRAALYRVREPVSIVDQSGVIGAVNKGEVRLNTNFAEAFSTSQEYPLLCFAPPLPPEQLGDAGFRKKHALKFAYVAGAMANGISSVEMVVKMGNAGMLGVLGTGGMVYDRIVESIQSLKARLKNKPFGMNLIHSPGNPGQELDLVRLYHNEKIRLITAAAYMNLTLPLVYYRVKGIYRDEKGAIIVPNKMIGKVSRIEVARKFFAPPPQKILNQLLKENMITPQEAELATQIPMAEDLTVEADSGGHTDNRPALALLPTMLALRDEMASSYAESFPLYVGLGGGIATPESAAAAFSMGAAYVLTGSINQACVEAGTSAVVRQMLCQAGQADVTMAPSADMFEMGVKVQVLKRGTMFPQRAAKLYQLYRTYERFEDIPEDEAALVMSKYFQCSFEDAWQATQTFFKDRDPRQIERADRDAKHKMALVFRSYLGRSSLWSIQGDLKRKMDYQIWCGPAIGAFNEWVKGSFLEQPDRRQVDIVAMNLLMGAAVMTRVYWLFSQYDGLPPVLRRFSPMPMNELQDFIG